jgi:hypothetical protein
MTRLIQITNGHIRRVAWVDEPHVRFLDDCSSIYELAQIAIDEGKSLSEVARSKAQRSFESYDAIYNRRSQWRLLAPLDHPHEPSRCLVSGTGLTHLGSARGRQSMHETPDADLTDSMKMFRLGVDGGRPEAGAIGNAPEWFYKGTGDALRAHGEPLDVPSYAEDGGEEAEIAGLYLIGRDGRPYRIGFAVGNEFSDHRFEKKNYLYLAGSKLRNCSLGPEVVVDSEFWSIPVTATALRDGSTLWTKSFRTGEAEMCHSLQNIEHHHFKFEGHRRPGDVHVHFFGTNCLSFSDQIRLQDGDIMRVEAEGFGRALENSVRVDNSSPALVRITPLL